MVIKKVIGQCPPELIIGAGRYCNKGVTGTNDRLASNTNCTLQCRKQFQSLQWLMPALRSLWGDNTTKEQTEQSERMRHLVVKSV